MEFDIKNHRFFNELNWNKLLKQEIQADYIPEIKSDNELIIIFSNGEI